MIECSYFVWYPYEPKYAVFDRRSKRLSFSRWINTTQLGGWNLFFGPWKHRLFLSQELRDHNGPPRKIRGRCCFFWFKFLFHPILNIGWWGVEGCSLLRSPGLIFELARSWEDVTSRLVLPVDFVLQIWYVHGGTQHENFACMDVECLCLHIKWLFNVCSLNGRTIFLFKNDRIVFCIYLIYMYLVVSNISFLPSTNSLHLKLVGRYIFGANRQF